MRKFNNEELEVMLVENVCDLTTYVNGRAAKTLFIEEVATTFSKKGLGEASFYMGCHIKCIRAKGVLTVDQYEYIETIVDIFVADNAIIVPAYTTCSCQRRTAPQSPTTRQWGHRCGTIP